jgi:putative SOS response-associated peptidase YedK
MPGRFSLGKSTEELESAFPSVNIPRNLHAKFNILAGQPVAVITNKAPEHLDFVTWGLIPSWSTGVKMTKLHLNARSESVATTRSFKSSFRRRRCLVLADGYYEWIKIKGRKLKIPFYVYLSKQPIFAFAGIWDSWQSIDGSEIKSFCIITTEPNEMVAKIHHRMGVILHEKDYKNWLQAGDEDELHSLLVPYPADEMSFHQVSTYVSKPANEGPKCIEGVPDNQQITL